MGLLGGATVSESPSLSRWAPFESGRGCKSKCTSGQVGGLFSPGKSWVRGVEIALGITGRTEGTGRVDRVLSVEESASSMKADGLRFVSSHGQEGAVHSRTGLFGSTSLLQTDRASGCT